MKSFLKRSNPRSEVPSQRGAFTVFVKRRRDSAAKNLTFHVVDETSASALLRNLMIDPKLAALKTGSPKILVVLTVQLDAN